MLNKLFRATIERGLAVAINKVGRARIELGQDYPADQLQKGMTVTQQAFHTRSAAVTGSPCCRRAVHLSHRELADAMTAEESYLRRTCNGCGKTYRVRALFLGDQANSAHRIEWLVP